MNRQTPNFFIGIDVGTSSLKTVLVNTTDLSIEATAIQEYSIQIPHTGWAEQNPEIWWQAAITTIRQMLVHSNIRCSSVKGIGLSGQMHTLIALDRNHQVIRPAILWADQRSQKQVNRVYETIGKQNLGSYTRNPLAAGFTLASWLWMKENEKDNWERTSSLLLPKDYLRLRLTGQTGSDPSDAAGTLMFDPLRQCWSQTLLEALEISPDVLPPLQPSSSIAGELTREAADALGLDRHTPVIMGGGDQAMQAYGNGLIHAGHASCTIGTGGQFFVPVERPDYDEQLRIHLFNHVIPGRWYLMAATLAAGLSLRWARDCLFPGKDYRQLADAARNCTPGADGLIFLPHLVGERTPYMNGEARAMFYGLTLNHTPAHLVRAIMEGVVFSLRLGRDIINHLGVDIKTVTASGGAVQHPLWLKLQADILNTELIKPRRIQSAAYAAACLALEACTNIKLTDILDGHANEPEEIILPDARLVPIYDELFQKFCRLYPDGQKIFTSYDK